MPFAIVALALACTPAARGSTLEQSRAEGTLRAKDLVGVWSCGGMYAGKPVTATMRWYHLEDGSLWNTLHPVHPNPRDRAHATIVEQWQWDVGEGPARWLTSPDPSSSDAASFTSSGFTGRTMTWIRQAAESTMRRTFTRTGPNLLRFDERYGGDGGTPTHVIYSLSCKRTSALEPPPA